MPFRLIGTIVLLLLFTVFASVNLENKSNIDFVFYKLENIPVFVTIIISFAAGAVLMFPFTLFRKKKKNPEKPAQQETKTPKIEDNSKTLFDFKIKRETNKDENPENKQEEKKSEEETKC